MSLLLWLQCSFFFHKIPQILHTLKMPMVLVHPWAAHGLTLACAHVNIDEYKSIRHFGGQRKPELNSEIKMHFFFPGNKTRTSHDGSRLTGQVTLEASLPQKCSLILSCAPAPRIFFIIIFFPSPHRLSNSMYDLSPESFKSLQAAIQKLCVWPMTDELAGEAAARQSCPGKKKKKKPHIALVGLQGWNSHRLEGVVGWQGLARGEKNKIIFIPQYGNARSNPAPPAAARAASS